MRKIFLLFTLISFAIFTSCNKEEAVDEFVPAEDALEGSIITAGDAMAFDSSTVEYGNNNNNVGIAAFSVNNDRNTLIEKDELSLTNNSINAVSYHWDFGNGATSTEASPTNKNYKVHGNYTITLTVTDAQGQSHKTSHDILVLCLYGGGDHPF